MHLWVPSQEHSSHLHLIHTLAGELQLRGNFHMFGSLNLSALNKTDRVRALKETLVCMALFFCCIKCITFSCQIWANQQVFEYRFEILVDFDLAARFPTV